MEKVSRMYKISGTPEQLRTLEKLFVHMEYLGTIGASRNLLVQVDGDGAARMTFKDSDDLFLSDYIKDEKTRNSEQPQSESYCIVGKYSFE